MNVENVESHPDFDGHETVEYRRDENLKAFIAVHNSNLGPAVGGCRMFPYATTKDALTDVLRLSRGMTYKSALAGLPLGGGKAVIIADPQREKSRGMLLAMGDFVDSLQGQYITAEDSGTGVQDIGVIGERTRHVSGVNPSDKFGGDPSPVTAYGVFVGIREAVNFRCKSDLKDVRVAIQGVGNVGFYLAKRLIDAGASVVAADTNRLNLERARNIGVRTVPVDEILSAEVDVLAPCAMGGAISRATVNGIQAGIVAGAANNQLGTPEMGGALLDRGILYAPDYVINAGGIIGVYYQKQQIESVQIANEHVESIGGTLRSIFQQSDVRCAPTSVVADEMAEAIFQSDCQQVG
ncbi:MAG: Glu/Leu/Phe/Val family dehydrogenase [Candidatus Azotimanducaceae bacterium WSBS_2022_MAG_OTU7]